MKIYELPIGGEFRIDGVKYKFLGTERTTGKAKCLVNNITKIKLNPMIEIVKL